MLARGKSGLRPEHLPRNLTNRMFAAETLRRRTVDRNGVVPMRRIPVAIIPIRCDENNSIICYKGSSHQIATPSNTYVSDVPFVVVDRRPGE